MSVTFDRSDAVNPACAFQVSIKERLFVTTEGSLQSTDFGVYNKLTIMLPLMAKILARLV